MGVAGGTSLVKRVAYRLLNIFPPNQFKFKIFWVDDDVHVRGMFDLHCRYGPREVIELLTEMQTVDADVGGPSSSAGGPADMIPCSPIHFAALGAAMQLELNSDEGSDEDFIGDTDDSSVSSDESVVLLSAALHNDRYVQVRTALSHDKRAHATKSLNKGSHRKCTRLPDLSGMSLSHNHTMQIAKASFGLGPFAGVNHVTICMQGFYD
ncbi:hypothetical protein PIB30_059751 [Stylosanthes scabra]|uniref:Uncharacterized protein n=1 Tax=Stylosanthes scabra TaxID=79078 RepID=A0ABU6WL28_9FABA|nr:hypothetical protein [Stylosanthes scabra]